jgi:PilZ domain
MGQADTTEHRHDHRKSVLKRAQVVVDGAVLDCIVENLSETGAKLRFAHPAPLPEAFALRFTDGTSHAARRTWSRGATVGIAFEGGGPAAEAERQHLVEAVREASLAGNPAAMLDLLRTGWFFGDEHLRRAAADLELAQVRFTVAPCAPSGAPEVADGKWRAPLSGAVMSP